MKKQNSNCEFSSERSELLIRNYRESLARQSQISMQRAFTDAVETPAPRFWVSEARAMRVVTMMMKQCSREGADPSQTDILEGMHTEKRKMYLEIYRRVLAKKKESPETPLGDIVFEVVNSPAPRYYLTWYSAQKMLQNNRKSSIRKLRG